MGQEQSRRQFLAAVSTGIGGLVVAGEAAAAATSDTVSVKPEQQGAAVGHEPKAADEKVDFRYSPLTWQTNICFPDDPHKTLVGDRGEFLYGYDRAKHIHFFPVIIEFSMCGMGQDEFLSQHLESPSIPILHTMLRRAGALLELTTFATNHPDEGRVDNVIMTIRADRVPEIDVMPKIVIRSLREAKGKNSDKGGIAMWDNPTGPVLLVSSVPLYGSIAQHRDGVIRQADQTRLEFKRLQITRKNLGTVLFRFPQEGQTAEKLQGRLDKPMELLAEAREFWTKWKPTSDAVAWSLPGKHAEFLSSCARNILQAREVRDGKLTFQVGAANYRGLWVVDGHFILEAARYLGYDKEAQQGLETTWSQQREDGGIFAGGGDAHWKDTAIAMFTMVRQAELGQNWEYLRKMRPQILKAVDFLIALRDRAKKEGGGLGQYGLMPKGFGDGGVWGHRPELTNTVWALAGLKGLADAATAQGLTSEFAKAIQFHKELNDGFAAAARAEMRRHPDGFDYLPMLLKEDKQWEEKDEWAQPHPQNAQWALSHALYPGLILDKNDPVTQGHIKLMQACTQEDIPAETGWVEHGGVWNYNASFVAHVYLWAGLKDWARRTFIGFLNHAAPTYCWREEQPFRNALVGMFVGDMPHNWASAECVRFLRHMLVLEDGTALRLLDGVASPDVAPRQVISLKDTPTRFGRVTVSLEPGSGRQWTLHYKRGDGPAPKSVTLPEKLAERLVLAEVKGASYQTNAGVAGIDPAALEWMANWRG